MAGIIAYGFKICYLLFEVEMTEASGLSSLDYA